MPSAGGTVPPVYGFIEVVRAFGNWARCSKKPLQLVVHVGPQVLLNLTSHQIGLNELLNSTLVRFWTVVNSGSGTEPTRRVLYRAPEAPIEDVLTELLGQVPERAFKKWSISLCPSPKHAVGPLTDEDLHKTLCDAGVVFGSVLTLSRTRRYRTPELKAAVTRLKESREVELAALASTEVRRVVERRGIELANYRETSECGVR